MRNHQRPKSPYIVAHWFATRFCFDLGLTTFKGLSSCCHVQCTYILALQRSDRPFLMLCERLALSTKLFEWNPRTHAPKKHPAPLPIKYFLSKSVTTLQPNYYTQLNRRWKVSSFKSNGGSRVRNDFSVSDS